MDLFRLKVDFGSRESEIARTLCSEERIDCAVSVDHVENVGGSATESVSDYVKEGEDNDSSLDKVARRPVETWKYLPLQTDCNRMSYKCSLCCSVYQHKKSLNKHWKDKHLSNLPSSSNSIPFQERIPSNITNTDSSSFTDHNVVIYPSEGSIQPMMTLKREPFAPNILTAEPSYYLINRKRLSLQITEYDENKENYATSQPKRLSLLPMQSLMFRGDRNICETMKMSSSNQDEAPPRPPQTVRPSRSMYDTCNPGPSKTTSHSEGSLRNLLENSQPETCALDLRISKLYGTSGSLINFRCFQCVFHTNNIVELNEHFKHLHLSILLGIKSFCLPMSIYQKLLLNQFTAIVRTESEPLEVFNGPISCFLCFFQLPSRFEMIQHMRIIHEMEMIWVCLVCGFGCRFPAQLSHHFRSHSDIHMLAKSAVDNESVPVATPIITHDNSFSKELVLPKAESYLATSTPNASTKRIVSRKDHHPNSEQNSSKEKPLKCLVCDATARWRSELFTHMITHSEHRSFGCKFCCYRSKWKWDVPKHLKRCRMAPESVRKPDIPNSYLITLLHHYSPPPGDILYEFMKQYNIKDLGVLNRPMDIKVEEGESTENQEQSTSGVVTRYVKQDPDVSEVTEDKGRPKKDEYELISEVSEEDLDLDVGTDHFFNETGQKTSEQPLKCLFKKCPWCNEFLTNKPSEMSSHLAEHHADVDSFKG